MPTMNSLPGSNAHLSTFEREQMIEEYGGVVDGQIAKRSIMRGFVSMPTLLGTDTRSVRRMGSTTLQGIGDAEAGQRPIATSREFDRAQVIVDTILLARDNRSLLNEFQTDFAARKEIGMDHGKTIAKFFDTCLLNMGIKAALTNVTAGVADTALGNFGKNLDTAFKDGKHVELAAAGDEADPDKLYRAFSKVIVEMEENDVDPAEGALFLRPTEQEVLVDHPKLVNRDFSKDNGDFADGTFKTIRGVPVVSTARLNDPNIDASIVSNAIDYQLSGIELNCLGLIIHPQSLLGAETIPLTSNVHYSDTELQWFIDSYLAFGASVRRGDQAGAVFSYDAALDA